MGLSSSAAMRSISNPLRRVFWMGLVLLMPSGGPSARAMDYVTLRRGGKTLRVEGRLVLTAQDGGILLLARDGVLWNIEPAEQVRHTSDELPFRAYPVQEMSKRRARPSCPPGFEAYHTAHYLMLYDTSRAYAQWCGALFERLYGAFHNAWSHRGVELAEPEFPLVADHLRRQAVLRQVLGQGPGRRGRVDHRLLQSGHQPHDHVRPDGRGGRPVGPRRHQPPRSTRSWPTPRRAGPCPPSSTRRRTRSPSIAACTPAIAIARSGSARASPCTSRPPTCTAPRAGRAWGRSTGRGWPSSASYLGHRRADSLKTLHYHRHAASATLSRPWTPMPRPGS